MMFSCYDMDREAHYIDHKSTCFLDIYMQCWLLLFYSESNYPIVDRSKVLGIEVNKENRNKK